MRQISKKLGKFLGEWSGEAEADRPPWSCGFDPLDLSSLEVTLRSVIQLQAQESSKTRWVMPGPAATTNDPLPCHRPISRDRDLPRSHLEKLMNILLKFSPKLLSFTKSPNKGPAGEQAGMQECSPGSALALPSHPALHRRIFSTPRVPGRLAPGER